jgi:hypothetical protein
MTARLPIALLPGRAERSARPIRDAFIQPWRSLVGFAAGFALPGLLVPLGALAIAVIIVPRRVVPGSIVRLISARGTTSTGGA